MVCLWIYDVKCICAHSYFITERQGAGWFEIVHVLVNYGVVCRHFGLCEAISGTNLNLTIWVPCHVFLGTVEVIVCTAIF